MFDIIQTIVSLVGIIIMIFVAYGGRKHWEGKLESKLDELKDRVDKQYDSTKLLCIKHQEHIEHLDINDATQTQELKEHERRIVELELGDP